MVEKNRSHCQCHFGMIFFFENMNQIQLYGIFCSFFRDRLPFDWQTPAGYFATIVSMFLFHVAVMWWLMNILFCIIGFVSFLVLFADQLECELEHLNMGTKKSATSQLNTKIYRIIELHCEAKQLNKIMLSF